jgi:hypothetical protein
MLGLFGFALFGRQVPFEAPTTGLALVIGVAIILIALAAVLRNR